MSERDFRAELEAGQCKPNHGCNVCRACMCELAEEAIDDNDSLRARVAELEAPWRNADSHDWDFLLRSLGGGGQGSFWRAVLTEVRAVLAKGPSTNAQDEGVA